MRTCDKCGKANQDTRKFCIRCGASLIKKEKPQAAPISKPTLASQAPKAPPQVDQTTAQLPRTSEDQWVKPSEVSRDRVRAVSGGLRKSELEKAREAFAKAETVGIDEAEGSGIIETRMLRASEVRELLEGPGMMPGQDVPLPTMMEGSEPLPPEAAQMMKPTMPTSSQIEESILGSKSGYFEHAPIPTPSPEPVQPAGIDSTSVAAEFSSSKYEIDADSSPTGIEEPTTGFAPHTTPVSTTPEPSSVTEDDIDLVITCPDCGKIINVDMFEYPREVYSAMAAARLKQARFFIVQGKGNDALRIVRIAHALYTKAGDDIGVSEVKKIIQTLAKRT
jgi:hypothetical protein